MPRQTSTTIGVDQAMRTPWVCAPAIPGCRAQDPIIARSPAPPIVLPATPGADGNAHSRHLASPHRRWVAWVFAPDEMRPLFVGEHAARRNRRQRDPFEIGAGHVRFERIRERVALGRLLPS